MALSSSTGSGNRDTIAIDNFQLIKGAVASGTGTLGISTAGSTSFSGNVTVNTSATLTAVSGGTATFSGAITGNGSITKTDVGTVVLSGNNTFSGATTVSAGTFTANATSGQALGSTSGITIKTGGTLLLGSSNQINNSATIGLAGGTFQAAGFNETAGNLTLSANSTIDFGSGAGSSTLTFGTFTNLSTYVINVLNFDTGDQLIFSGDLRSLQSSFSFSSTPTFAYNNGFSTFSIAAVPEPGTIAAGVALLAFIAYRERRRFRFLIQG